MKHLIYVNETLATGLRKRLLRETGQDFSAALECLFRDVAPKGCQRFGSTHRRVVAYIKRHFRNRIVREVRQGTGRREVWACELLLPEQPDDPANGALALIRVEVKRRAPLMPDFTNVGVRVSQHLVERVLQRRGDGAWDMAALTAELRPALNMRRAGRPSTCFAIRLVPHLHRFTRQIGASLPLDYGTWVALRPTDAAVPAVSEASGEIRIKHPTASVTLSSSDS